MKEFSQETKEVLKIIKQYAPIRPSELTQELGISYKNLYKHLRRLQDKDLVIKTGGTPKVYYTLADTDKTTSYRHLTSSKDLLVEHNYIYVTPTGVMLRGLNGFETWCNKNSFDIESEKSRVVKKFKAIQKLKRNGLLSRKKHLLSGKYEIILDKVYFSDFYTVDYYGKTKLGQLVYIGKSSQNKDIIKEIAGLIKPSIDWIIQKHKIKYIGFIPPTIDRKVQFLDVLESALNINLPKIKISKVPSLTKIPQKTLRKLEDRILNAKETIAVSPVQEIKGNVLIIDDATGSGATLNETAKKIKNIVEKNVKVIGYSVVGSYKGFDVISEV